MKTRLSCMLALMALLVVSPLCLGDSDRDGEATWIKLTGHLNYSDPTYNCTSIMGGDFYLLLQTDKGVVRGASFSRLPGDKYSKVDFTKEELGLLSLYTDKFGRFWLKAATLNNRLAYWAMRHSRSIICSLPQPLRTLSPLPFPFQFDLQGLGDEVVVSGSQKLSFTGVRQDGKPYRGDLKLFQRHSK